MAKFADKFAGFRVGHVDEEQVLRDGGAQFAAAETLGELGGGFELFAGHAAAQNGGADVAEARLALGMDAGMVAKDIARDLLFARGKQREVEARLQFCQEAVGGPALLHEEVFEAGAIAAFAQTLLLAEDFGDGANCGDGLMRK